MQIFDSSDRYGAVSRGLHWAVVERLYGDWRPARRWLQVEGVALHRYRFGD